MPDLGDDRDPVELLAAEFIERHRRGEQPTIEHYIAAHPDLADEIRDLFPTIAAVEQLKVDQERSSGGCVSMGGVRLERLGDFRIIREIGRGGMGIVYEAMQESLDRHVAVKVLPKQALLEPSQLQRFQREARLAARLHHTNIVPVFGVGRQDDYHYIVMQYIRGVGLDEILDQLRDARDGDLPPAPLSALSQNYWHGVARIGLQVAGALDYAHSHGTIHRDIKPANLLIDSGGLVWITDFGLAQAIEQDGVSQDGDVVGTLRYMAPEQLAGKADPRSDIYSLGATLYELVARRPAYEASNRSHLVQKITKLEPTPLHRIDATIPRDLETIVVKAMAREPARRYESAAAMADDLQRFVEDRPITARPISAPQRLWRWCRRNRAVAALTGTAATLLLLVAVTSSLGYFHTRRAERLVREALRGESDQRLRAEATRELALEAVDTIFDQLAPRRTSLTAGVTVNRTDGDAIDMPAQPVLSEDDARLLEQMLVFYDRLADRADEDASLKQRVADANRRIGDIHQRLGHYENAMTAYRKALDSYQQLLSESPGDPQVELELVDIYHEMAVASWTAGKPDTARDACHLARDLLESAPVDRASTPGYRFALARTHFVLGRHAMAAGGGGPHRRRPHDGFGPGRGGPGPMAGPFGGPSPRPGGGQDGPPGLDRRPAQRRAHLARTIRALESLVDECPTVPEYRQLLARCYREMPAPDRADRGEHTCDNRARAVEILSGLVEAFPGVPEYRHDLIEAYAAVDLGEGGMTSTELSEAADRLRTALDLSNSLIAQRPNIPDYLASQVHIRHKLADILRRDGQATAAESELREAIGLQSSLVSRFPDVVPYRVWLATIQGSLARLLHDTGQLEEARDLAEESAETLASIVENEPRFRHVQGLLEDNYACLADVLDALGEADLADEARRKGRVKNRTGGHPPFSPSRAAPARGPADHAHKPDGAIDHAGAPSRCEARGGD